MEKDLAEEEQARRDLVTQVEDWRNDIKRLIIEKDARVVMMQLELKKSMMDDAVKVTEATIKIERKIRVATVYQEIKATICKKAIYGTMNAALLAYKKLAKLFRLWGFKMNPYDACVWNKVVNTKQFTIVFHIDDLLMSHPNPNIVTLYIRKLEKEYGSLANLTVTSSTN